MSLYLKYRPQDLSDIIGNDQTVEMLEDMLDHPDRCPHAFLLHGPKGCGKTTLARIISKRLGVMGVDFKEMDTADFRGIEVVREMRKQANYKPLEGPRRVWLLDEVHKMTNDAQNALLKILEDTPKHVYFILCTTDPQKLLPTVRDRCSSFNVHPLSPKQAKTLLKRVVKAEGEMLKKSVYAQIIEDSQGHPRAALQILDQVLRVSPENRMKVAKKTAEEQSQSIELCRALISRAPWSKVSTILTQLKEQDPESIRRHVLGYAQAVLLKSDNEIAGLIMEEFLDNFYDTGYAGLVFACYSVTKN